MTLVKTSNKLRHDFFEDFDGITQRAQRLSNPTFLRSVDQKQCQNRKKITV